MSNKTDEIEAVTILDCLWCGGRPRLSQYIDYRYDGGSRNTIYLTCDKCFRGFFEEDSVVDVINRWNASNIPVREECSD